MINDFRKEHLRNSEYEKVTMDKIDELSKDMIFLTMYDYNLEKDVYDKPIGLCELSLSKRGNRDTIGVITVYFKEKYRGLNFIGLSSVLGSYAAQEAIKGLTNKYTPISQWFYYDCFDLVCDEEFVKENDRYDCLRKLVGNVNME